MKKKKRQRKGTAKHPLPEWQSRENLLATARRLNCEGDIKLILEKYDRLLKNCTNEKERHHIAITGLAELHNFLYCKGPLVVGGKEILPAVEEIEEEGKIIKLD